MLSFDFFILISGLSLAALSVYLFSSAIFTNNTDADALAFASGDERPKSKSGIINFSRPLVMNFTLQARPCASKARRTARASNARC